MPSIVYLCRRQPEGFPVVLRQQGEDVLPLPIRGRHAPALDWGPDAGLSESLELALTILTDALRDSWLVTAWMPAFHVVFIACTGSGDLRITQDEIINWIIAKTIEDLNALRKR